MTYTDRFQVLLVTRIPPTVGDTLVLVLTLIKTVALKREAMQVNMSVPIVDSLLSHGMPALIPRLIVQKSNYFPSQA